VSEPKHIKVQRLLDRAFDKIKSLKLVGDESRNVLFEKHVKPNVDFEEEAEHLEYDFGGMIFRGHSFVSIEWGDANGRLHSFNGMPSRITYGSYKWLEIEWHKHGEPYRKNNLFNRVTVTQDVSRFFKDPKPAEELNITLEWLNSKGQLHSFNDMPSKITKDSVQWHWNGINCRKFNYQAGELPCYISNTGNMHFCYNDKDTVTSVKFPLSTKNYGQMTLYNVHLFEKYVKWPLRQLLTL